MSLQNWVEKHLPNSTQKDATKQEYHNLDLDNPVTFECGVHLLKIGTQYCVVCLLTETGEVYDYWRGTWTGPAYVLATYNTEKSMLLDWFNVEDKQKEMLWGKVLPLARAIKK